MKQLSKLPSRQKGSIYTTLVVVIMIGLMLTSILKIAPAFVDNNVIKNSINTILANNDPATLTVREVRADLYKTLTTNNVDNFNTENVVFTKEKNKEYIDVNYETRLPLFYNIDVVVKFENRFDKS